ncbi:MAG: hypothetical protein ACRD2N_05160 [Vicinamibacterales bacterium]
MAKKPVSLTLEESNLLWLKGRARVLSGGSVSEAVDQIVAEARAGRIGAAEPVRSVIGTIDLSEDPDLAGADDAVRALFTGSLARSMAARGPRTPWPASKTATKKKTRARG